MVIDLFVGILLDVNALVSGSVSAHIHHSMPETGFQEPIFEKTPISIPTHSPVFPTGAAGERRAAD